MLKGLKRGWMLLPLLTLSGCTSLWDKGTEYQQPDYYATNAVPAKLEQGKRYFVKDLRCRENGKGCGQTPVAKTRQYTKPYYLSQ